MLCGKLLRHLLGSAVKAAAHLRDFLFAFRACLLLQLGDAVSGLMLLCLLHGSRLFSGILDLLAALETGGAETLFRCGIQLQNLPDCLIH